MDYKGKICYLIFGHFFSKCTFLRLWYFFLSPSRYLINSIFQRQYSGHIIMVGGGGGNSGHIIMVGGGVGNSDYIIMVGGGGGKG